MGQAKRAPKFSAHLIIISIGIKALHECCWSVGKLSNPRLALYSNRDAHPLRVRS